MSLIIKSGITEIRGINKILVGPTVQIPKTISGLVAWYDANQITGKTDGNTLYQWDDSSSNGYHAVSETNAPIYKTNQLNGLPVVRFSSTSAQGLKSFFPYYYKHTLFVIARMTGLGSDNRGRIISNYFVGGTNFLLGWHGGKENSIYADGWVNQSTINASTNWKQYTSTGDHYVTKFYSGNTANGSQLIAIGSTGYGGPGGSFSFNGYNAGSGEVSDCEIAEVILYKVNLNDTDKSIIETYLFNKYNL